MISENLVSNKSFKWFDVERPESEDFKTIEEKINLPFLLVQDTLKPEHLPKYEFTDDGHFFMLRSFDSESFLDAITVQELTRKMALFVHKDTLITIHRVKLECLNKVIDKIKRNEIADNIQSVVHQIIMGIIRSYEAPVLSLQNQFDDFEEKILSQNIQKLDTSKIYHFRRKLFVIKRILTQTYDALYRSRDFWVDSPSMLQDLKENIDHVYYQLDEISDNFEHLFQLHISLNDQRANEVMKVLTVFSTILLPLNFIASFYGMNFEFLPGLHSKTALIWITSIMFLISLAAIFVFKQKGWFKSGE